MSTISATKVGAALTTHSQLIDLLAGLMEEIVTVVPVNQAAKAKIVSGIETLRVGAETLGVAAQEIGTLAAGNVEEAEQPVDTSGLDAANAAAQQANADAKASLGAQG